MSRREKYNSSEEINCGTLDSDDFAAYNINDTVSEAESLSEEERVRKLFMVCDADGDGFIDSHDLSSALQELGLDGAVDVAELMEEMGADDSGKVSYEQFLQCRLSHKSEIDALRYESPATGAAAAVDPKPETKSLSWMARNLDDLYTTERFKLNPKDGDYFFPTSSEHSMGTASGKHESWEFDSGARDLSPEPNTLHKLIEAAGGSLNSGNTSSLLALANKLHLAALGSLKTEIAELNSRLQRAVQERDTLEQALAKTQLERLRLVQESEERLERQSTQYEERLTELHSVIAELTRKLNRQQYNVIREEGEDEVEEEDNDAESHVKEEADSPIAENAAKTRGYTLLGPDEEDEAEDRPAEVAIENDDKNSSSCSSDLSLDGSTSDDAYVAEDIDQTQRNRAGEDDLDARAVQAGENLQRFLYGNEDPAVVHKQREETVTSVGDSAVGELRRQLVTINAELIETRNALALMKTERDQLRDIAAQLQPRPLPLSSVGNLGSVSRVSSPVVVEEGPVCKVAERVRLRRLESRDRLLTGSKIASVGVQDVRLAEQLVSSLHEESAQEEVRTSLENAMRIRELELEVERFSSRAEHLRAQNDVMALTLAESRAMGERLAVLLGKYESNCTALRLALERADKVSEAYEVLAALVESEMSLLLANCQVAGIGLTSGRSGWDEGSKDVGILWKRATDRRRSAENVARSLLSKHERERDNWEDSGRHTCTTASSASSGAESGSGSGSNPAGTLEPTERKVRDLISRLKADRLGLERTVQSVSLPLESALIDPLPRDPLPIHEARKMDLEMAVIMQELMAMREERAKLRTQVFLLEKERAASETQQRTLMSQIRLLQTQYGASISDLSEDKYDPGDQEMCSQREQKLKVRIQELVAMLDKVTQAAELRHQQSTELVNDVKKANATLLQLLERSKKKYQSRVKRLEQQMVNMSERHAIQVRVLKQRISALEGEAVSRGNLLSSGPSETSL